MPILSLLSCLACPVIRVPLASILAVLSLLSFSLCLSLRSLSPPACAGPAPRHVAWEWRRGAAECVGNAAGRGAGRAGATISVVDGYYTPGGNVTNGFDIQTPSAVHDGGAATTGLSSDYTRADGTVFDGAKGPPTRHLRSRRSSRSLTLLRPHRYPLLSPLLVLCLALFQLLPSIFVDTF